MSIHDELEAIADYLETDRPSLPFAAMMLRRLANDHKYAAATTGRRTGSDRRTVNDSARRSAAV